MDGAEQSAAAQLTGDQLQLKGNIETSLSKIHAYKMLQQRLDHTDVFLLVIHNKP